MSYIVLARKWRPRGFDDIVGQEPVVTTLKNALAGDKIAHAYLFSGPRGVGKTSLARIRAKALNCEERSGSEPCGSCQSCEGITQGSSVDVFEIDGASNNSVDAVRELRETVKYAPAGGKYKIYIIDEVHMLSTSAFNALLKTLEEPPPHVIFIFATTEPKKIPPTILSRCQHHAFRRITKNRIREQLKKITDKEKINIKEEALEMIAKAGDGSMRDALTLLDQAYSFSDEIDEAQLQTLLGLPETEVIMGLSESIIKGDISRTLSIIKELTDRGSDLRQLTKELLEQFRSIAIVKITGDAEELLEFSPEEVQALRTLTEDTGIEPLTLLLSELLRLEGEVRSAINPRYTLELGLLRMSFVKGMTSIDQVLKMLGDPEPSAEGRVSAPAVKAPADHGGEKKTLTSPPADSTGLSELPDKDELWKKLIDSLDAEDHLLSCKLASAKVVSLTDTDLSIGFNGGMSVLADSIKSKSSVIKPLLRTLSSRDLNLKIVTMPKVKGKKDIKKIKEEVYTEKIVQDAVRIFNSSVLQVKPLEDEE